MAWFPRNVFLLLLCKIIFQGPCGLGFLVFELLGMYLCFVTFFYVLTLVYDGSLAHDNAWYNFLFFVNLEMDSINSNLDPKF